MSIIIGTTTPANATSVTLGATIKTMVNDTTYDFCGDELHWIFHCERCGMQTCARCRDHEYLMRLGEMFQAEGHL